MRRRNLRLPSSSDEDDPPPPENAPLILSDDEFMDAEDDDPSNSSLGLVDEFLRRLGLALRREWLASCLSTLARAVPGFDKLDVAGMARMCFEHFLCTDINCCGAGILPDNVHCMNIMELEGPFVLQVDEVTNISCPLRERYHDSPAGLKRCLKLSLSDGVQHVFGMEYRPIHELEVLSLAGLKIIIRNVQIRRGLLLLLPEVVEVIGGLVEDLDAARQRLIKEVNKPPRGKRKEVLLPLCQRATLAAWPSNTVNNNEANTSECHVNNIVTQASIAMPATLSNPRLVQDVRSASGTATERNYVEENVGPNTTRDSTEDLLSQGFGRNLSEGFVHAKESIAERCNNDRGLNAESSIVSDVAEHVQDGYAMDDDDAINDLNNPPILTGEKEIPFTYLACLLAKWIIEKDRTSFIQGRIKCILTGVKRFQFRGRSTYELLLYVDDGSYISEVFIDHNVVQNGIGYSPEHVTAALSSSDKKIKADMAETMQRYQLFLSMYEGTILLEMSKNSPLPVVLEMSQGCSASDAWLLLRRLKSFTSRNPQHCSKEPIVLSP